MHAFRITLCVLTVIMTLLTLMPFSRNQRWWVRVWDFPRLQMATLCLLFLLTELMIMPLSDGISTTIIILTVACMAYQSWWILPYTPFYRVQVKKTVSGSHSRIKIMNSNVMTTNRKAGALIA